MCFLGHPNIHNQLFVHSVRTEGRKDELKKAEEEMVMNDPISNTVFQDAIESALCGYDIVRGSPLNVGNGTGYIGNT